MRTLPPGFARYEWAPSTRELARTTRLNPREILRFDGNVPAQPPLGTAGNDRGGARAYAGPGDTIAIAESPTYPLYRLAAGLAGAEVGEKARVVTFSSRPNNPTGKLGGCGGTAIGHGRGVLRVRGRDGPPADAGRRRRPADVLERHSASRGVESATRSPTRRPPRSSIADRPRGRSRTCPPLLLLRRSPNA